MATSYVILAVRIAIAFYCAMYARVLPVRCQTLDQNIKLMADNLNGYDRRFRPVLNQSKPIIVNATFNLISLRDVDEVQEAFSVTGVLVMSWYDEKLTWNPASYGGIQSQVYSIDDIWYPIMVLTNPSKGMKNTAQDWMTIRVNSDGLAIFHPMSMFEATCSIDVTYFPFDIQNMTRANLNLHLKDRRMPTERQESSDQSSAKRGPAKILNTSPIRSPLCEASPGHKKRKVNQSRCLFTHIAEAEVQLESINPCCKQLSNPKDPTNDHESKATQTDFEQETETETLKEITSLLPEVLLSVLLKNVHSFTSMAKLLKEK